MVYRSIKVLSFLCIVLPQTVYTAQGAAKVVPAELDYTVWQALKKNDVATMQKLLDTKQIEANMINGLSASLLSRAVLVQSEIGVPQLLLQAGARVDERSMPYEAQTPLFCAIERQKWPLGDLLLSYGADAGTHNRRDNLNYTPCDSVNIVEASAVYFSPTNRNSSQFWYLKGALLLCNSNASTAMKLDAIRVMQLHEKQAVLKIMQARRNNQLKKGNSVTEHDMRVLEWLGDTQAGAELRKPINETTHMPDVLSDMVVDYWLE